MRKALSSVVMLLLLFALAACGSDKESNNKEEEKAKVEQTTNGEETPSKGEASEDENPNGEPDGYGGIVDPTSADNEFFKGVHKLLQDNGYEVGDITPLDYSTMSAYRAVTMEVNGENRLPLQIFEYKPEAENLKTAKESGTVIASFGGHGGEVGGVIGLGNHVFTLSEGHPDQEAIYKLLEENYK